MKPNHKLPAAALLLLLWTLPAGAADAARVVVSIKPIHALVAGIMEGTGTPELLLKGNQSPHSFALRPSDMKTLNRAELVFWVGDALETPMVRVLASLDPKTRAISLMDSVQSTTEARHEDGDGHSEDEGSPHRDHHHDEHHHEGNDPHIWLSVKKAMLIVERAARELSRTDPDNAGHYQRNSERLLRRLRMLDAELDQRLSTVRSIPYIVFHDAYRLFEQEYGLNHAGAITINPEQLPGARRLHQLRRLIQDRQVRCIFSEPQFQPRVVETIISGTQAGTAVLDPIGTGLEAGAETYFTLMRNLANSFAGCLERQRD
jgi:zinc transport system substrate-binding protein